MEKSCSVRTDKIEFKGLLLKSEQFIDPDNGDQWRLVNSEGSFSTPLFIGKKGTILTNGFGDKLAAPCMYAFFVGKTKNGTKVCKVTLKSGKYEEPSYDEIDLGENCENVLVSEVVNGSRSEVTDNIRVEFYVNGQRQILIISKDEFKPKTTLLRSLTPRDIDNPDKGYKFAKFVRDSNGESYLVQGTMDENFNINAYREMTDMCIGISELGTEEFCFKGESTFVSRDRMFCPAMYGKLGYEVFIKKDGNQTLICKRNLEDGKIETVGLAPFKPTSMRASGEDEIVILSGKVGTEEKQCYFSTKRMARTSSYVDMIDDEIIETEDLSIAEKKPRAFLYTLDVCGVPRVLRGIIFINGQIGSYFTDVVTGEIIRVPFTDEIIPSIDEQRLFNHLSSRTISTLDGKEKTNIKLCSTDVKQHHEADVAGTRLNYDIVCTNDRVVTEINLNTTFTIGFDSRDARTIEDLFRNDLGSNNKECKVSTYSKPQKVENMADAYAPSDKEVSANIKGFSIVIECQTDGADILSGTCKVTCTRKRKVSINEEELGITIGEMGSLDLAELSNILNLDLIIPKKEENQSKTKKTGKEPWTPGNKRVSFEIQRTSGSREIINTKI